MQRPRNTETSGAAPAYCNRKRPLPDRAGPTSIRPAAAVLAAVLATALLAFAAAPDLNAQPAQPPTAPSTAPSLQPPAGSDGPARPRTVPEVLRYPIDPSRGFQFGFGFHRLQATSGPLNVGYERDSPFSDGGSLILDFLLGSFRLGYQRQVYRREAKAGMSFQGEALARLGVESDQFWAFHGFRPWHTLYLGYGLGVQRREIALTKTSGGVSEISETLAMAGLMVDYTFAPPLSLQIRIIREDGGKFLRLSGETVFLSYIVPF